MYSKEEKKEYFKNLREEWKVRKELAESDTKVKEKWNALQEESGGRFSYYSYYFTLMDMQALNLPGQPYVDTKTFKKWREVGFKVKKGEKAVIRGITWMHPQTKDGEDESFLYPKVYNLFHFNQVEKI
jgi:hypothetical protein